MRAPLRFCLGNLLWSGGRGEVWALYRLGMSSYSERPRAQKLALLGELSALCYAVERDLQLLRVTRAVSPEGYLEQARACLDPRHAHRTEAERYLEAHRLALAAHAGARPECFLALRIAGPPTSVAEQGAALLARRGELAGRLRDALGLADPRGIPARQIDALRREEERVFALCASYAACERATSDEVQWLVRRAYARGVSEPLRLGDWRPQALVFHDERGEARLRPLEHDVLRLFDVPIEPGDRSLRIVGEDADSHQALFCLGALPDQLPFPDPRAELLFAPLEALSFPVDACPLSANVTRDGHDPGTTES